MKIRLLSDLHLEFSKFRIPELPEDSSTTLVLAGDIGLGKEHRNWMEMIAPRFERIIYVLGNHEFYHKEVNTVIQSWLDIEASIPNLYFLNDDVVEFDGVRFIGSTLWTNFKNRDPMAMMAAQQIMNDYKIIKLAERTQHGDYYTRSFLPKDAADRFDRTRAFIETELSKEWKGKTVVVTHHAPSEKSVHPRFKNNTDWTLNYAYFSDLETLIEMSDIDLWIHGHTHDSFDYMVGKTRILCNPRGYAPHDVNSNFQDELTVDI